VFLEVARAPGWPSLLLNLCFMAAIGLLSAEAAFRLLGSLMKRDFFARYGAMVAALCFGGLLDGATTSFVFGAVYLDTANAFAYVPGIVNRVIGGLIVEIPGAVGGGAAGLVEDLILGFPLAAILGLFANAR
jgi:hypothetical protein